MCRVQSLFEHEEDHVAKNQLVNIVLLVPSSVTGTEKVLNKYVF